MHVNLSRSIPHLGAGVAAATLLVACGGGGSGATPPTLPASNPITSPTSNPSANPSSHPSSAPSSAPSPTASPTSLPQTYTLGGATSTLTGILGQIPAVVSLAPYNNVAVQSTFGADTAGNGTIDVSDATGTGDITPNTLPADNATAGFSPVVYLSFYNPNANTISFGTKTPLTVVTNTAGFGTATTCNLDVYANAGGGTPSWHSVATGGVIAGAVATIQPTSLSGSDTLDFQPGQQMAAVSCN